MEEGICSSPHSLKLTTVVRGCLVIVLAREGVEVNLHAAQTKTQQFLYISKNCIIVRKHVDHRTHLVTNLTIQSNYWISRIPRYCCSIATDPPPCFTFETRHAGL